MFEWAQEKTTYNGNLYGVGGFAEIVGIYYRADLFEELGLEPPSTWDAMIGAADRALEEGILPFSLGALEGWPYSHLCGVMLHAILPLDTIFEIETLEGSGTYNDYPESLEAIEECQHWAEQRYFPTDMTGVTYVDSRNDFITGVGLMRIDGSWAIPELQTTQLDINFMPFPMKNPELPLQNEGGISSTWVVLEGVVDLDAALDFLDYVVFDEEVNELWMQGGLIPSVSFDTANIEAHPFVIQNLEAIEYISTEGDGLGYWVVFAADPSYSDASIAGWQALLLNQITPQQLSDMLSEAMLEARRLRQ
jgi:ABC-type glycerol-3-phosphate transport system substrate-binding protein